MMFANELMALLFFIGMFMGWVSGNQTTVIYCGFGMIYALLRVVILLIERRFL